MLHKSKSHKLKAWKYSLILPVLAWFLMSFHTKTVLVEANVNNELLPNVPETATTINGAPETTELKIIITKDFSEKEFETVKAAAKKEGVTLSFSNIERNSKGEIIAISAEAKTEKGSSNFNLNGTEPIKPFVFNYNEKGFSFGTVSTMREAKASTISGEDKNIYFVTRDTLKEETPTKIIINKQNITTGNNDVYFSPESSDSIYIVKDISKAIWTDKNGKTVDIHAYQNDQVATTMKLKSSDNILYIIDGKKATATELHNIAPNAIESVNVYKDNKAVELYGAEGKEGVIIINTKGNNTWTTDDGSSIVIRNTSGNKTYEIRNNELYAPFEISKETSDSALEAHKEALAQKNVTVKYSKLKRNKAGEIIKLKISLSTKNDKKSSATFEDPDGIPNIVFGKNKDNVFVKSIN